ncbi:MAG: M28 family peptidase [Armatimonadetes bacterium]|nr:M28 family peptidase [Armatimonadota bacterium]MCX7967458.1 M28 family peptidase [Armatimonadota bacterium]MDW8143738.1 M28 family peptidase [Armatimonadota bacterium]
MGKRKFKVQQKSSIGSIANARLYSFIGVLGIIVFAVSWRGCIGGVSFSVDETNINPATLAFNSERAFDFLVKQVEFGPRVPGTEESVKTQNFIAQKLQEAGAKVLRQKFSVTYRGKTYQMANVIGIVKGKSERKVLLCAHYDTRPVADQDPNPENRNKPIPGANDGASGVAVLLEIAQVLKTHQPPRTVVFAFFDGEDLGDIEDGGMFFGSKHFARNLTVDGINLKAEMGVLLDMVGDRDFKSNDEWYSRFYALQVVSGLVQAAQKLGYSRYFFQPPTLTILDDHVPLNEIAGIPTANIIDFDYPYWHTLQDTPDKCSPQTLSIVGKTVLQWLMSQQR